MDKTLRIKILEYLKEQDAVVDSIDIKTPFIEYLQNEEQRTKFFRVVSHLHSEKLIDADGYYDLVVVSAGRKREIEEVNITARLKTKGEEYLRSLESKPTYHIEGSIIGDNYGNQSLVSRSEKSQVNPTQIKNKPTSNSTNVIIGIIGIILAALGVYFAYLQSQ